MRLKFVKELDFKELANSIKYHRKLRGLSIKELSELTEIDETYLTSIESALRRPSTETLVKILNALTIDLSECLSQKNHESNKIFYLRKVKLLIENMSKSQLIFINNTIKRFGKVKDDNHEI